MLSRSASPPEGRPQRPVFKESLRHPLVRELVFESRDSPPHLAANQLPDCLRILVGNAGALAFIPCAAKLPGQDAELFLRRHLRIPCRFHFRTSLNAPPESATRVLRGNCH